MDIELFWDQVNARADIGLSNGDLAVDHDLKTAVLISLFTDRRAEDDDVLPDAAASKRGWWGDALGAVGQGRRIGSRLWLLQREKQLSEVLARAKEYAEESLAWLVDDGVALAVTVSTMVVVTGTLGLVINIQRPKGRTAQFRFDFAWTNLNQVGN